MSNFKQTFHNTVKINDADVKKAISRIEGMRNNMLEPKVVRRIKVKATEPMQSAIRSLIHNSERTRERFAATYVSGNLKRSIRVLSLKKRELVYLGVRVVASASGVYGGNALGERNRASGWYGHMVEYGTKGGKGNGKGISPQYYFRAGVRASQSRSMKVMQDEIIKRFDTFKW